jgi:hypothetical protein
MGWCGNMMLRVEIAEHEKHYHNVENGHIVLTSPNAHTFDQADLNTPLDAKLIVYKPET